MDLKISPENRAPARQREPDQTSAAPPLPGASRTEVIERALFWALIVGLAWAPFWYGSNDLVAWGINAVLFPGLAALYEISILVRGERHPIAIKNITISAALFAGVVVWILLQNATWVPATLFHPIWSLASDALERSLEGSISVNRDLTTLALIRLITAASVFWLAMQLCRNQARASLLIKAIAAITCFYAAYGLVAFALKAGRVPWFEAPSGSALVSSTFINQNSFATYAGIGLIAICGLILRLYRHEVGSTAGGPRQLQIAAFIETTGQRGATLLGGAFLILVALLLTGSRGGIVAAGLGLFVLGILTFRQSKKRSTEQLETIIFGALLVGAALIAFGDVLAGSIAAKGLGDTSRIAVYLITLWSILDAPLAGHGYGTFPDVFPMYRDRSAGVFGVWEQAHNTYLEVFQGLGLVFGSMLIASVLLLVLACVKGATTRRENLTVPRVAASVGFLVGVQALVDFSLQIQAISLTFMAVLGAGVAQSQSSRLSLRD